MFYEIYTECLQKLLLYILGVIKILFAWRLRSTGCISRVSKLSLWPFIIPCPNSIELINIWYLYGVNLVRVNYARNFSLIQCDWNVCKDIFQRFY